MSERMPRFSELASRRSVLKESSKKAKVSFAFLSVTFMLLAAFLPLISNVGAVSQSFSNTYNNGTDVTITDGGGVGNPVWTTVAVGDNVIVTGVDVTVDAPRKVPPAVAGRARDVVLTLVDPSGNSLEIFNSPGLPPGQQDVFVSTSTGFFNGQPAFGVWTLYGYDKALNNRYNYINDFTLTIYWDYHTNFVSPSSGSSISGNA